MENSFRGKGRGGDRPNRGRSGSNFDKFKKDKPPFRKERDSRDSEGSGYKSRPTEERDSSSKRYGKNRNERPPFKRDNDSRDSERSGRSGFKSRPTEKERGESRGKRGSGRFERTREDKHFKKDGDARDSREKREYKGKRDFNKDRREKPAFRRDDDSGERPRFKKDDKFKKPWTSEKKEGEKTDAELLKKYDGSVRLNKYIANTGVCSRREADELIKTGVVSVNGKVITEMGYKVKEEDVVKYNGETVRSEKLAYVLLNKPKDYITTSDDPQKRKTVMQLIRGICKERIYPVGRLDRNTTGVLLFTNDGELTARLTHPKYGVRKIYHVSLDMNLRTDDLKVIQEGVTLEDGLIKPDIVTYAGDGTDKKEIGIEIHSGKNRIVRRIFEHFGYEVVKLDRVYFAGLTKKDLPKGRCRVLTEKEIGFLKMAPKGGN